MLKHIFFKYMSKFSKKKFRVVKNFLNLLAVPKRKFFEFKMIRFLLLIGVVVKASENYSINVANDKYAILQQFDELYVAEVKSVDELLITAAYDEYPDELKAAEKNSEEIDAKNFKNDVFYFLKSGFTSKKENTRVVMDIYLKYLAMWASLIFKVGFLWEYNAEIPGGLGDNKIASCKKASFYMTWFHTVVFDGVNKDFANLNAMPAGFSSKFSTKTISKKLTYINAVTLLMSKTIDTTFVNKYHLSMPQTQYFEKVKKELEKKFPSFFAVQIQNGNTPVIFSKKTLMEIWIQLFAVYGQDLIDVENYFNSMLGGIHEITDIAELIPKYGIYEIWNQAKTFSDFLASKETGDDNMNKAGKILMKMEKLK